MTPEEILGIVDETLKRHGVQRVRRSAAEEKLTLIAGVGWVCSVEKRDGSVSIVYEAEAHGEDPERPVRREVEIERPVDATTVARATVRAYFDPFA